MTLSSLPTKQNAEFEKSFWIPNDGRKHSVGAFILAAETGKILMGMRSPYVGDPNLWGTFGGGVDEGESLGLALIREIEEEAGYRNIPDEMFHVWENRKPDFSYHNFLFIVDVEFRPKLNYETSAALWFDPVKFPRPLHPGCIEALRQPEIRNTLIDRIKRGKFQ